MTYLALPAPQALRTVAENPPGTIPGKRLAVDCLRTLGFPVFEACEAAQLPVSTYYYRPLTEDDDPRIMAAIAEARAHHPDAGYRTLTRLLRGAGLRVNHKRVYRLCRAAGFIRPKPRPQTRLSPGLPGPLRSGGPRP